MRIAQQENSVEKRGWVAWFTRKTNKTSSQEVCTTYIGRRRPSILPKERRHWGLPCQILEAQAKLVSLAGLHAPDGTQPEVERKNDVKRPVFWGTDPIFYFSRVCFYTLRCYTKVTWGQQSKVRCFIQMYTEVLGVIHHLLARGPADNLWPSPCDSSQSTRTLISPGVIVFETDATFRRYQIKLHSYRVRV